MDAAAELGRNRASKHQIQPDYGDDQADAERDCWTRPARLNSQARTRTANYYFFLFNWPRAGLATPCPVDAYSCYILCVTNMKAFSATIVCNTLFYFSTQKTRFQAKICFNLLLHYVTKRTIRFSAWYFRTLRSLRNKRKMSVVLY